MRHNSTQYFSKRLDGRLYIACDDLSYSSLFERIEQCIRHVEQRVLKRVDHRLPQNIQVVLYCYQRGMQYYMVDVHPDHQHIFWLDEFDTGSKYRSPTHLSKSGLNLRLWNRNSDDFVRTVYGAAKLATCCTLSSCQYIACRLIA